jgi:glutamate-ammonia-ligase adenylyltransferase
MLAAAKEKFSYSPYLTRLLQLFPEVADDVAAKGPDAVFAQLMQELPLAGEDQVGLMKSLRIAKGKLALLTAMADINGSWTLAQVTRALSDFAERAVTIGLESLMAMAHQRGDSEISSATNSGIIILAMGKLGAHELNYSSDIDLMVFFERDRIGYKGRHNEQHFMNKLAHDLVHILQERTADGYVFRTDLRLRPDPASTPPAISTAAALYYYESVGQNWERAAMIKARQVAGDSKAGEQFLKNVSPFMWRRNLDFAAINDIHSIKRQMDARQSKDIQMPGHNIKLGMGGIREIEFFVQIHQLIWGGKLPALRVRGTCETLDMLVTLKLTDAKKAETLKNAYVFLRTLEHRLQMIDDEQTHTLPENADALAHIAAFMGYKSLAAFEKELTRHLYAVHDIFSASFRSAEKLGDSGNLVFTGVTHDPDTLATLAALGYTNTETASEIIMGWHHGSCRATRTKRARELLTELMPTILKRLAETANPDIAFLRFNEFLKNLPAGVQLFSLFGQNPQLLGLIADIMGSAPTLAERLSKSPGLLDAVLYSDFYDALPDSEMLEKQWRELGAAAWDIEEQLNGLRRFRNEKQFQAGVQLLKGMITAKQAGVFLSNLANLMVQQSLQVISEEFKKTYGKIKKAQFGVLGLGKLGSCELTFNSDIDLIFVYDSPDGDAASDGEKSLNASVYYNRFAQRLINALSAMEREGRLYEVDTRLRPSGGQGLLAVSFDGLKKYFSEAAWTFESMAFTKARPIAGDGALMQALAQFVEQQITKPRLAEKLKTDVMEMRDRIETTHGSKNPWQIKFVRGGSVDVDFLAQYLLLLHATKTPGAKSGSAAEIYRWLKENNHLPSKNADMLIEADRFLGQIFNMLRLCVDGAFDEDAALPGLKKLLCESSKSPDFETLKSRLIAVEAAVLAEYNRHLT